MQIFIRMSHSKLFLKVGNYVDAWMYVLFTLMSTLHVYLCVDAVRVFLRSIVRTE